MPRPALRLIGRTVVMLAVIAFAAGVALGAWWLADGARLYVQSTPSMLSVIPVGSLVVLAPARWSRLHPGEIVGVRPTPSSRVVVHYVASASATTLRTHNLLSHVDDAWVLHPGRHELVGRSVAIIPGLGWVLNSWPIIALTLLGVALFLALRGWKRLIGLMAGMWLAGLVWLVQYHPLAGLRPIGEASRGRTVTMLAVSRGLTTQRVTLKGVSPHSAVVAQGGLLKVTTHVAHGASALVHWIAVPQLPWWGVGTEWVFIVLPGVLALVTAVMTYRHDVIN